MLELFKAGGWLMWPILFCGIGAVGIILERFWSLQTRYVAPKGLLFQIWQWAKSSQLTPANINALRDSSPLGRVLAAGLDNLHHSREIMKESIEEVGRHVVHELERYLNSLGTIASVSPLLGLLGTVFGMIQVFSAINVHGVGNPTEMAGGIAKALLTTAAGLSVAIPSLMFYRYFRGRVDAFVVMMEQEAIKMVETLHGERAGEPGAKKPQ
ncbi:MAG: MotA/TolQ/ExbB proton channel family protein [Gammaproteobacteria bacterium]|nr:MotA/TolQ/ExbB proton channel family protein [Gammaproteobacteria bacterium]